ncbi:RdgB/HAM1 family non-canonical purine NTP pyrophosphatase [Candidatus Poribacteria bacterium]|nr:RdgB/HAM1 family non-canonical purine NTP pyrophosphatase [Candidatus Poribacteria bacterium]MBT5532822.1 RdgB/HAM1 family non-canonical purine NTP pyrophosphatase [Candidatus Poribacteria bacterium]MBT5712817.1 RdgB/HAM1 family non-canonical purine NTP pyrophosphatase [Candidatus Poribacteria bacterium]MBT7101625.1 RdgB/HAM1 family non-canonical purine NTP pyrophosphatase [Candidatus Poribacteria bacterium]MBT7808842.1 RdgB/HAM1 family non-canonical purine NTP pyrophosphatase [Candidatus Po
MMRCVLATSNSHKRDEIAAIFEEMQVRGVSFESLACYPDITPAIEDGATFAENARIKALHVSRATGGWALTDDSGLAVDALDGRPGVHSARYGGEGTTDAHKIELLLEELADVPMRDRTARFVCHMVLAHGESVQAEAEGVCDGVIAAEPAGSQGFGYDPIVYIPELGATVGQLSADGKNAISHRARAARGLAPALRRFIDGDA